MKCRPAPCLFPAQPVWTHALEGHFVNNSFNIEEVAKIEEELPRLGNPLDVADLHLQRKRKRPTSKRTLMEGSKVVPHCFMPDTTFLVL